MLLKVTRLDELTSIKRLRTAGESSTHAEKELVVGATGASWCLGESAPFEAKEGSVCPGWAARRSCKMRPEHWHLDLATGILSALEQLQWRGGRKACPEEVQRESGVGDATCRQLFGKVTVKGCRAARQWSPCSGGFTVTSGINFLGGVSFAQI